MEHLTTEERQEVQDLYDLGAEIALTHGMSEEKVEEAQCEISRQIRQIVLNSKN